MSVAIKNTSHSIQRTTRERSRFVHVSQWYKGVQIIDPDTKIERTEIIPQFTVAQGKDKEGNDILKPKGKTDNRGRNMFKRICRAQGFNRIKIERGAAQREAQA